jgi:hypothetical protein
MIHGDFDVSQDFLSIRFSIFFTRISIRFAIAFDRISSALPLVDHSNLLLCFLLSDLTECWHGGNFHLFLMLCYVILGLLT